MTDTLTFPGESAEYRAARDALLAREGRPADFDEQLCYGGR